MKIGIVGLPNVGKSTLFNALTRSSQADAQNYPFCTIDPNIGVVDVPDDRLAVLTRMSNSAKTIPAVVEFVDIAGLVKGASQGEGLGNQFLSHIREVDAVMHVVRDFENGDIVHVAGRINPADDKEVINLELALADLATVTKVLERLGKTAKAGTPKELLAQKAVYEKVHAALAAGKPVRSVELTADEQLLLRELHLITAKPMLYVVNVDEKDARLRTPPITNEVVYICAKIEADIATLPAEEAKVFLQEYGMTESGLDRLVRASYALLNYITYFTTGEMETRAWTITRGMKAPQAAGVIHTDFEKGFIRAEVIGYEDFVACGGEAGAREKGKLRIEGKEYEMRDGDICHFRFQ